MNIYSSIVAILLFLFGVSVGSFLNVVIFRMGSGTRFGGRSKCLSCGKTLTSLMLIPIISYVLQRGRCAHCAAKVSIQYPLVEFTVGVLFVLIGVKHAIMLPQIAPLSVLFALLDAGAWSLLVAIVVYDVKHKIIPDIFAFLFAMLSGTALLLRYYYLPVQVSYIPFLETVPRYLDAFAAPLVALPLALIWLFTRGRGMGLGDAKLAWGVGWFLGFGGAVTAIVFSFWIAFFPSIALLFLRSKNFTMKSEIPFAPFIILGTLLVYLFDINMLSWVY